MNYNYYVDEVTGLIYRVSVSALKNRVSSREKIPVEFLHTTGGNMWDDSAGDFDAVIIKGRARRIDAPAVKHLAEVGYDKDYFSRI